MTNIENRSSRVWDCSSVVKHTLEYTKAPNFVSVTPSMGTKQPLNKYSQ
jgi:hypothetical protein